MRVTTAEDTLEFDDLNNDIEYGQDSCNLGGTPLTEEETFLRVSYHDPGTASEPYRLYTTIQPPLASATPESEPNDTIGTANTGVNNYFFGNLPGPPPSTDADFYAFDAEAGDLIHFGLDGDPLRDNTPINPQMAILDPNGTVLRIVNDGAATSSTASGAGSLEEVAPFSPAEGMVFRIQTSGTYYLRVTIGNVSPTANGAGDYLLSIAHDCQALLDPGNDDDGDTVLNADDCAPLSPGVFAPPSEITNLRLLIDTVTIEWDSAVPDGGADTVHDIFRGVVNLLPVTGDPSEICLLPDSPPTSIVDPDVPPLDGIFYYLARGHNTCADGTFGFATDGTERISEGPNGCP
jgi:hypothetical protein